ncbi:MAG: hypothetical protein KDB14_18050, partial [Planctomycetales bacterium]|nr:hypothetical protein [Planctomycetales bacterium]
VTPAGLPGLCAQTSIVTGWQPVPRCAQRARFPELALGANVCRPCRGFARGSDPKRAVPRRGRHEQLTRIDIDMSVKLELEAIAPLSQHH